MSKKAVVAGHICIDITPVFPDDTAKIKEPGELLKPGKLINMEAPDVHTGGAVANTGLGMKKLGADVSLVGKVGDDAFGGMVRDILDRYQAAEDLIVEDGEITSYSIVLAPPGIDRMFLHCPGANDTFDGNEISDEVLEDAALFHFGYPPLMQRMYEEDGRNLAGLFRRIRERGIITSLDMAAVDPDSRAGKADWRKIIKAVLPYVDFFVPSFEELCFMIDRDKYDKLLYSSENGDMTDSLSLEDDTIPLAEKCLEMGAKSVLIKCGAPGLYLMTSDDMDDICKRLDLDAKAWRGYRKFEKSYRIPKVLSGTGAGDTCIAAFLTGILGGAGPEAALQYAAAAGALCCMSYDAVSGLPKLEEIRKKIDAGWEKAR